MSIISDASVQIGAAPATERAGGRSLVRIGSGEPLAFICGPCVIESRDHLLSHAERILAIAERVGVPLIFKSSYDKANRTSGKSFRGVGIGPGLEILNEVREQLNIPVVTDVHTVEEARRAGEVVDLVQVPAFLCRQTDLLLAAGATRKAVIIKKGQFVAPQDMKFAAEKVRDGGCENVLLCERGTCFGYRDLVVDFRSLSYLSDCGCPVIFDATHSVQQMGGANGTSSGNRAFVAPLARAAAAYGVDGFFLECHEAPETAPSDGANMVPLDELEALVRDLKTVDSICRGDDRLQAAAR